MSLLLRRRAMMQLAEEGVEGGGPNDGKVIVFRGPYNVFSAQRNRRYVSTDYGHSYTLVDKPRYAYTSSNDVDSEGGYWGNTASVHALIWVTGSNPTATTPVYTGSAYQYGTAVIISVPDKNGVKKMVRLQNSSSGYSRINRLAINYISGSTVPIDTPEYPSSQLPLPSYMSSQTVSPAGASINGNRADLSKLVITTNGGSNIGSDRATASVSLDGGLTWNNVKDIVQGTQSALPDGQYRDSVWSFDGTKCAIVYNNDLYVSKDGGQSFELRPKAAIDSDVVTIAEVKGTEKLKTLYLLHTKTNNTHSLKKSTDFGRTWETVYDFQSQGVRFLVSADGQHMIYWNTSNVIGYSDDLGHTWVTAGGSKPTSVTHSGVVGSARMSLDSLNEFDELPKAYNSGSEINNIATEISFSLADTGSARKLTLYSDTEGQNIAYDFPPTVLYSSLNQLPNYYWWLYSCSVDGLALDNRFYIVGGGTAKYAITGSCEPYGNVQWAYSHDANGLQSMASDLYQHWGIRSASHG